MPMRGLPGRRASSTISTRPLAKESRFKKEGNWSSRKISLAAVRSGLIIMLRPSSSFIRYSCWKYSGLRTRAMVWRQPSFLA